MAASFNNKPMLTVGPDDEEQLRKIDIEKYFTREQLETMADIEKMRYRRIKQNYEAMLYYGLPIPKPSFMQKKKKATKVSNNSDNDEQDEEWRPRLGKVKDHFPYKKMPVRKTGKRVKKKRTLDVIREEFLDVNIYLQFTVPCMIFVC